MADIDKLIALNNQYYASLPLSVSMGMASCTSAEGIDDMLRRADLAMYAKKKEYHGTLEALALPEK